MKGMKIMSGYYTEYKRSEKFKKDLLVNGLKDIDHVVNRIIRTFANGKKNAISSRQFKEDYNIKSDGEFQAIIERLRNSNLHGRPIAACGKGYFIPQTKEEFAEWLASYEYRAEKMIHTSENARKKWNEALQEEVEQDE